MTTEETQALWMQQYDAIVERMKTGAGVGLANPADIAGLTGLQQMQAMLRGELPYAAIAKTLDFLIVEVGDGTAIFQGTPLPQHLNPLGTIHGGWVATMLDS
eukprot:gene1599-2089_t